jgi:hypothetical protein
VEEGKLIKIDWKGTDSSADAFMRLMVEVEFGDVIVKKAHGRIQCVERRDIHK